MSDFGFGCTGFGFNVWVWRCIGLLGFRVEASELGLGCVTGTSEGFDVRRGLLPCIGPLIPLATVTHVALSSESVLIEAFQTHPSESQSSHLQSKGRLKFLRLTITLILIAMVPSRKHEFPAAHPIQP